MYETCLKMGCVTHCSFSSLHSGSFRRSNSIFTPESLGSLLLRLSSLRCDRFNFRPETRAVKPSSPILQYSSLQREREILLMLKLNTRSTRFRTVILQFVFSAALKGTANVMNTNMHCSVIQAVLHQVKSL